MSAAALYAYVYSLQTPLTAAAPYLALAAFLISIVAVILLLMVRRRLVRLALGRNGSIEESIALLARDAKEIKEFRAELEKYLKHVEARLRGSVQGVGVVRFNPFNAGQGGNQSFAAAFLDEHGSGVVFSTLYARDRVGVYAKPIDKGVSPFELTDEERGAIVVAQERTAQHTKKKK